MPQEQVFSEQEVTEIIRRAVQLSEQAAQQGGDYKAGITRSDLEKVASEIGVDAKYLEQAILESRHSEPGRGLLRFSSEYERVVEGELDPNDFDLVTDFVRTFGRFGPEISQIGRSIRAKTWTGASHSDVEITSRNGRTKVKVTSNPFVALIAGIYPALMGSIISAGALSEAGLGAWAAGAVAGFLALGAGLGTWMMRSGQRKAKELADDLRDRIQEELASKPAKELPVQSELEKRLEQRSGRSS